MKNPRITTARKWQAVLVATAATFLFGSSALRAAIVGQWDFENGNLTATVGGRAMTYVDGAGGATETQTQFLTSDIGGQPAKVMRFPACTYPMGYFMPTPVAANGGDTATLVNQWTLLLDIMYPPESDKKWRAIIETDGRLVDADADLFVNTANGIGISGVYSGQILTNTWYRVAFVIDQSQGVNQIRKYIDGVEVGVQGAGGVDGRWALAVDPGTAELFNDNDGDVSPGYVSSIQLHNAPLTAAQIAVYGGATAAGLPTIIPSSIQSWSPAGKYARQSVALEVVINDGDTTIADGSIVFKLDDQPITDRQITRSGDLITVRKPTAATFTAPSKHTLQIEYVDSKDGARSLSREFEVVLFFEDFESLTLGPNVDEGTAGETVWTATPPTGWTIDNSGMQAAVDDPDNGVTEWEGWGFANKAWWVTAAGDQTRSQFANGTGTVAIADPDEWDDKGNPDAIDGYFNSVLKTPSIPITGITANTMFLVFDSSWRPEAMDDAGPDGLSTNNQTGVITVAYDGGQPIEVLRWDSVSGSATYHPDSQNESKTVVLNNPAGAQQMVLTIGLLYAGNDWWWAIDNVVVNAGIAPPLIVTQPADVMATRGDPVALEVVAGGGEPRTYQWFKGTGANRAAIAGATSTKLSIAAAADSDAGYYSVEITNPAGMIRSRDAKLTVLPPTGVLLLLEDFEGLPLGPNVDEATANAAAWTHTMPTGWSIDNDATPGLGDPAVGVIEWEGWSFANRVWWALTAADQRRSEFTRGIGTVAIADGDEWDDKGDPDSLGKMDTSLRTSEIGLAGVLPNSVKLSFDSSWRPEPDQKASISVSFDGGAPTVVKLFHSDPANPDYKDDNSTNDRIDVAINNPVGAQKMVIIFRYYDAGNNWWWAIDNVKVTGQTAPLFKEDFEGLTLGPNVDETLAGDTVWTKTPPTGWSIDDTGVPGAGTDGDGVTEWAGWSFALRTWWAEAAGDQRRTEFLKGVGTVAIADSDEWDDIGHDAGNMDTLLKTPEINITGREANALVLRFNSSWRPEPDQKATITATYDGGAPVEILRFESVDTSPSYKDDSSTDDTITIPLNNPAGATKMVLTFRYFDTRNNWWWAIDNLEVLGFESRVQEDVVIIVDQTTGAPVLRWNGTGVLETVSRLGDTWTTVAGAISPYTVPTTGTAGFYRIRN